MGMKVENPKMTGWATIVWPGKGIDVHCGLCSGGEIVDEEGTPIDFEDLENIPEQGDVYESDLRTALESVDWSAIAKGMSKSK